MEDTMEARVAMFADYFFTWNCRTSISWTRKSEGGKSLCGILLIIG